MKDGFAPVSLADMRAYQEFHAASGTRAADYSFTNIWGWAEHYGLEWRFTEKLCWIRQTRPVTRYWAPMGWWKDVDWAATGEFAPGKEFYRIPKPLLRLWEERFPEGIEADESRGQWDYLYKTRELATLSGNRFHKKKNLFNQFLKKYPDHAYMPLTLECVESVLRMQEEWCTWNECPESDALMAENKAIFRVLSHWDQLPGLLGGFIALDGKVIAYTVGERLTQDTVVTHFEKGATEYKGIYQAINCFFARDNVERFTFTNREQDLDD
ncbi:MAG: phosphatidylglycerol lysyltransferase domain-containing protein, partial [Deltaproteobacteria bacterium]|nr:phosphatidylglycerol lysyltransferase domain-containing protein [Deltaproteobacteria bacterium]